MGIAAAALVVSTAAVTYVLTARSFRSGGDARIVAVNPPSQTTATDATTPGATTTAPESAAAGVPQNTRGQPDGARLAQRSAEPRSGVPAALASRNQSGPAQSDAVYGKEIEMLQNIVMQRKTQLDSSTVAVIQKNLEIIDTAIAQSRAALAKDPASRMLNQQLTHALDKKVELLRTAAMLPVST
jgi:hypothetical protein